MKIIYEYECINQNDVLVAKGDFTLDLAVYSIRSPDVETQGFFGLIDHEHELFSIYSGTNHLKKIHLKAINPYTKKSRVLS